MKKIIIVLASTALLAVSAAAFSSVKLSSYPDKLPQTGDFRGRIYRVTYNNNQDNPWVRLFVNKHKDQRFVLEFKGDDMAVANTLLDAQGKHIDAFYAYANGAYTVTFFELT